MASPAEPEDAGVGAGGEVLGLHLGGEEALGAGGELAVGLDLAGGHVRVGGGFGALEALGLDGAGVGDLGADSLRGSAAASVAAENGGCPELLRPFSCR